MMGKLLFVSVLFSNLLLISFAYPMCTDSRVPITLNSTLSFCSYNGSTCCNSTEDMQLKKQFQSMNISESTCASTVQSVLCARCDPFSGELYRVDSVRKPVPVLCNSTVSTNSSQSSQAADNYCSRVWDACQNVSISNSPFAPSLQGHTGAPIRSNITQLIDLWQSKNDFCNAFGGASSDEAVCFAGKPVTLNKTEPSKPPHGLCLEKIGNRPYLNMVAHPDGSNRAFFSDQPGKVWLATIPAQGSGGTLEMDESTPFVDLTDEVHYDTQFGMMGMAFHPNFSSNGRFFASFNCDKVKWPGCSGRCSCNSDVNCDPSKLPPDNGAQPCQYQIVVAEYSTNGTASDPSQAKTARPVEVRRIFTMGLPFTSHHGGQILFGPKDGYLYLMTGDGGSQGIPYNWSQNKKSLLGKILRLDINHIPSVEDIDKLGLWGNYSIPKDNPFNKDKESQPEIWALGLRNPWRCNFDSEQPSYFVCADVGENHYEEVNLISKGGNYGWRMYEGPFAFNTTGMPTGKTSTEWTNYIFPIMGYTHSEVSKNLKSASITGGYIYRSMTDPCMYGRYLFGDLYAGAVWAGTETPENSGNYTASKIPFSCARDSPIQCSSVPGSPLPALGYIFSYGEDNQKDIYILASSGVYRVIRPSRCNYSCSKENVSAVASPPPSSTPSSHASWLHDNFSSLLILPFSLVLLSLMQFW